MVSPRHKKQWATLGVHDGVCSGRAACRYRGLGRSTYGYQAQPPCERRQRLIPRSHEFSALHPRYGYRRIVVLLRQEGWATSRKQVQRLRRDAQVSSSTVFNFGAFGLLICAVLLWFIKPRLNVPTPFL